MVRRLRFELAGSASSSRVDIAAEATEPQAGTARQQRDADVGRLAWELLC